MPTKEIFSIKHAVLILFVVITAVMWFGALGPYCMSSRNDTLVIAWPITTILGVIVAALWAIHWVSNHSTKTERKDS